MEKYLEWLTENFEPLLVVVFGSYVRGEWTEYSDVDVLVVSRKLSSDAAENYGVLKRPGVDPIGYSPEAFLQEIARPNLLVFDALEYGQVKAADREFLEKAINLFRETKQRLGLTWTGETWRWKTA